MKNIKHRSRSIPDTHSTDKHLERADLQTFIWRQGMENIIKYRDSNSRRGQAPMEGLCPLKFSCE